MCVLALMAATLVAPTTGAATSPVAVARAALMCGEDEESEDYPGWPNFDEDCQAEIVVGSPGWNIGTATDAGAVFYVDGVERDSVSRMITARSLGFAAQKGARFGSSILATEVDGESGMDVVIGAPGESVNGVASAGAVYVVFGSPAGLGAGRASVRLTAASLGLSTSSGQFGSALTAWPRSASEQRQLMVGEPLATVDGRA